MRESELQGRCLRHLQALGLYARKIISANKAGTPDVLACIRGLFVGFEFKSTSGRQSEVQKFNEREIKRNGGIYMVIRDQDEFKSAVDEILRFPNKNEDGKNDKKAEI